MYASCAVPAYRSFPLRSRFYPFGFRPMTFHVEEPERAGFVPRANVMTDENGYRLMIELPGVSKEEIAIAFSDEVLAVSGEKKRALQEDSTWIRRESADGRFERKFSFRRSVDATKITAAHADGVLEIFVPFAEEEKGRQIEIKG